MTSEIHGSSVVIVGFGREGRSVLHWLKSAHPDVSVSIADKELATAPEYKDVPIYTGDTYLSRLSDFDTVIRSPGVSPFLPEFVAYGKAGGHITSATNIFFSLCPGVTVGITGTKGKSTTSSLIASMAKQEFGDVRLVGNIGTPMLDQLESATAHTVFVIEMSSHQLEDFRYAPHVAVVLGIVPEHMDYYPNFATYVAAKSRLVLRQSKDDFVIYDPANQVVAGFARKSPAHKVICSASDTGEDSVYIRNGHVILDDGKKEAVVCRLDELILEGNRANIVAAVAGAHALGVSIGHMHDGLRVFAPLPHRLERVGKYRGVEFINDSLATIPEATIHALRTLGPAVKTLIVGGYNRGLSFDALGSFLGETSVATLICFPDTGSLIWSSIPSEAKARITKVDVTTMEQAVAEAFRLTPPGAICLLSPASASYNLFRDYADRGDQFRRYAEAAGKSTA
jgi:UDP-N-acetylmuramoylalanine--D-glutamate ligase